MLPGEIAHVDVGDVRIALVGGTIVLCQGSNSVGIPADGERNQEVLDGILAMNLVAVKREQREARFRGGGVKEK